jgi:hypothetical protein
VFSNTWMTTALCAGEAHWQRYEGKAIHYRPWQAFRVPGGWHSQILRQSAHEGGKVVSPTHRPPLPQEIFLVLISVRGWFEPRTIVRPEGLCELRIPPSWIDPASFRFVTQCLNQLLHRVPRGSLTVTINMEFRLLLCSQVYNVY